MNRRLSDQAFRAASVAFHDAPADRLPEPHWRPTYLEEVTRRVENALGAADGLRVFFESGDAGEAPSPAALASAVAANLRTVLEVLAGWQADDLAAKLAEIDKMRADNARLHAEHLALCPEDSACREFAANLPALAGLQGGEA